MQRRAARCHREKRKSLSLAGLHVSQGSKLEGWSLSRAQEDSAMAPPPHHVLAIAKMDRLDERSPSCRHIWKPRPRACSISSVSSMPTVDGTAAFAPIRVARFLAPAWSRASIRGGVGNPRRGVELAAPTAIGLTSRTRGAGREGSGVAGVARPRRGARARKCRPTAKCRADIRGWCMTAAWSTAQMSGSYSTHSAARRG